MPHSKSEQSRLAIQQGSVMTSTQVAGLLQAELVHASCRTAMGISSKEEYYIPFSAIDGILKTLEGLLETNFVSKTKLAEVLATECNIKDILDSCDLAILPKINDPLRMYMPPDETMALILSKIQNKF